MMMRRKAWKRRTRVKMSNYWNNHGDLIIVLFEVGLFFWACTTTALWLSNKYEKRRAEERAEKLYMKVQALLRGSVNKTEYD